MCWPRSHREVEAGLNGLRCGRDESPESSSCYLWLTLNDACCLATPGCRCCSRGGNISGSPPPPIQKKKSAGELHVHARSGGHFCSFLLGFRKTARSLASKSRWLEFEACNCADCHGSLNVYCVRHHYGIMGSVVTLLVHSQ